MEENHIKMIGERVRKARNGRDMTQEALAYAASVKRKQISRLENGRSLMQVDNLARVAEVLGVSLDYLVCGKAEDAPDGEIPVRIPLGLRDRLVEDLEGLVSLLKAADGT